jgi:hypothetical protein
VTGLFALARRFEPQDLLDFFRKFYPSTPQFERLWIVLYESKPEPVKRTIRCFLAEFPARSSAARILLSSDEVLANLAVLTELSDESLIPLLGRYMDGTGPFEEAILTTAKLAEFPDNPCATALGLRGDAKLVPLIESRQVLRIVSRTATTSELGITTLVFAFESITDTRTPIYAVSFTLSNLEFFTEDGYALVPSMISGCSIQFQMKAKKVGLCHLKMRVVYTTSEGETVMFKVIDDTNLVLPPVSFLSSTTADFDAVWDDNAFEESRITLPLKFTEFLDIFCGTFFGEHVDQVKANEENSVRAVCATPDDKLIAVKAGAHGAVTAVQFKTQGLELLAVVDDIFRKLG